MHLRLLLESFVIFVVVIGFHKSKVSSSTSHVCSRLYYLTKTYSSLTTRYSYKKYYTSCGLLWSSRCARSVRITRNYYVQKTSTTWATRYQCCSGWRSLSHDQDCSIPICTSGCVNGTCTSPDKCTCNSGWTGSRCNIDVNECTSSIHGCQQSCINTVGSFICDCYRGYIKSSTKTCRDHDECTRSPCTCASRQLSVDVCNATCINSPGSYQCSCSKGFKTMTARRTICEDVNECSGYNNKCGKTQKCVNTLGSYYCVCPHGYKLKTNQSFCEVPDAAPVITQCIPLSYDSARIKWSPIPENKRNGIIRGYKIYFRAGVGGKWQKWQVQTIKSVNVTSYNITGLKPSTWYCFKMSVFTSKGQYRFWKESECWMIKTPSGSKG